MGRGGGKYWAQTDRKNRARPVERVVLAGDRSLAEGATFASLLDATGGLQSHHQHRFLKR
jgi:hypothetical protein